MRLGVIGTKFGGGDDAFQSKVIMPCFLSLCFSQGPEELKNFNLCTGRQTYDQFCCNIANVFLKIIAPCGLCNRNHSIYGEHEVGA
jgi:hypothetical protein